MAETQEVKNTKNNIKAGGQTSTTLEFASETAPEGGVEIGKDRFKFKPEVCKHPVQGFLLCQLDLPNPKGEEGKKRWYPFVVKLTKATKAVNREDQVVTVPAGEEVLMASGKLNQELAGIAADQERAAEVWIKVGPQVPLKNKPGQKMWTFDMKVLRVVPRSLNTALQLSPRDAIVPTSRQLAAPAGEEVGDDEIPF